MLRDALRGPENQVNRERARAGWFSLRTVQDQEMALTQAKNGLVAIKTIAIDGPWLAQERFSAGNQRVGDIPRRPQVQTGEGWGSDWGQDTGRVEAG